MPLSEDEQRILHQIEQQFYESDPAFAQQVSQTTLYRHAFGRVNASSHRVDGVEREIHEHLLDLLAVDHDGGNLVGQVFLEGDPRGTRFDLQEVQGGLHYLVDRVQGELGFHIAGVVQYLFDEALDARKIIGERMAYSTSTIPHFTLSLRVDMTEAIRLREQVMEPLRVQTGQRVSFTAILARAVATVLPHHPYMNASLADGNIILWDDIHLGIATSVEENLIVPVIREAQCRSLGQIVTAMADLTDRARNRRLTPSEMTGSTFTISNLGMFGIESFTAIINPPESAILAVGMVGEYVGRIYDEVKRRPLFLILYIALIVFFAFFYTAIVFNPTETAENLKKHGGFIPGIRPGERTAEYIDYVLSRITVVGALYLAIVCLIPEILISYAAVPFYLGGTSLLIVVSVTMDTVAQVQGYLLAHQYEGLIKRSKLRGSRRR